MQFYRPIVIFTAIAVFYLAAVFYLKTKRHRPVKTDKASQSGQFSTDAIVLNEKREPSAWAKVLFFRG